MTKSSHAAAKASEAPTSAQLKELFAQIENGRVTKDSLQWFLRGGADATRGSESSSSAQDSLAPLLTIDDVARLLKLSTRTVRRLNSTGQLPDNLRIGGSTRWRRDKLLAWIAANCPQFANRPGASGDIDEGNS